MRKVRLLLWRQTKHNKTLTTTLTPCYFLLTPSSSMLLLVEGGAKHFRASTYGLGAFASRASGLS